MPRFLIWFGDSRGRPNRRGHGINFSVPVKLKSARFPYFNILQGSDMKIVLSGDSPGNINLLWQRSCISSGVSWKSFVIESMQSRNLLFRQRRHRLQIALFSDRISQRSRNRDFKQIINFRPISTGCKKLAAFTAIKALQCKKPHGMQIHLARRNISRRTVLSVEGARIPTLEPINIVRTRLRELITVIPNQDTSAGSQDYTSNLDLELLILLGAFKLALFRLCLRSFHA
ncbi:hypothetical protein GEV33_013961 [Tenebrio molitor]|uniref:Uncharacterized protein n=1 Tax=Tenebrio molitor TaxID=7067 RepID=A0A8J6H661_TENMO|nr:hypothetical protein GEV33_013961 [Tenebrio molitor]